ncbi:LacI family DNA-binding transcriptional regulator [Streptomyces sp. MUM 203J]|uniref:LacI family DNA-binding transcriptional regulator n=1 Tax=Streptomyces sp. MUM 203J TaxID=2791990 RepID=UPI001F049B8E|nr:LacI family DNA-binding transcriptional regulator [Streptomyces sp. MUM 203J]MCH0540828.1 LacI family DNA-binding transcriptional regulator [Streptomyces sp. MUM 203J]
MGRAPTIRDVAERAGVSKSLVSLVLRGAEQVRPEKRRAVEAAVEELGYRPNAAARSLSERRTRTVGVLLNDLRNPWFVELLDGLTSRLHESGLHTLLADGHLNRRLDEDLTRTFTELRVDGLVAVGTLADPGALRTAAGRVPMVVAGTREPELPGVDIVAGDDALGARLATEHLIGLGHRRIAHIAGRGAVGELRRRAFAEVMREHGLGSEALVEQGDLTEEGGYRAMVRLLGAAETPARRPTAVFAFNDIACVGALSAAEETGLRVPRDLSLVGYDNTYLSRLRHLWLTTVDNGSGEVGRRAARCLLERIAEPAGEGRLILSAPRLEVRGTTGAPGGA